MSEENTNLVVIENNNVIQAAFATNSMASLIEKIENEARQQTSDPSTEEGRKKIRSLAYKIARSKTAIDKTGLSLTEGWREQIKLVNADRKTSEERLDALKAEVVTSASP